MPPCRDNARNANARNANTTPPIPDQEVSNVEFRKTIEMLAQSMTNQNNRVHDLMNENSGSAAARVRNFVRMNPPEFFGSQTNNENPQNFLDKIKKIFEMMQVTGNYRVELVSYQLKDVAHIWYTQ